MPVLDAWKTSVNKTLKFLPLWSLNSNSERQKVNNKNKKLYSMLVDGKRFGERVGMGGPPGWLSFVNCLTLGFGSGVISGSRD